MSFFKNLIGGGQPDKPDKPDDKDGSWFERQSERLDHTIAAAQPITKQCQKLIADEARRIAGPRDGKPTEDHLFATALIFCVVWQLVGWAWVGVKSSIAKHPDNHDDSPVYRLWEIMRAAFGTADEDECRIEVDKLHKRWGKGDE